MNRTLPSRASAVIIGGGVTGASVAYHLAKQGWQDVVLLERRQFSCGTTWHAAGLIGTMRANESHARLCEYSMSLLSELEKETGQATGFRQVGSLSIAHSDARFEELKRVASMNNAFGVTQVDIITPGEAKSIYPMLDTTDLLGASWVAQDGIASPVDVTMAFIKGARLHGAICLEGVKVEDIIIANGKVSGVKTAQGLIDCDFVTICGGMWSHRLAKKSGITLPLHACEHYYALTEKLDNIPADLPVLRDHDKCAYYREDAGSLLVGAFEKKAVAWGHDGIPDDFSFDEIEGHVEEQLIPVLEDAMQRVPMLQDVGWRKFFCGPESFTPDDQFHIGEVPEVRNLYVGAGLNSVGIQSSGGLGKALAQWMDLGHAPMDLWGNDIRRMHPVQNTNAYLRERVTETLGLLYENHYPFRQYATSRNVRHSPVHEKHLAHNACFGEVAGWERPNWYAPSGIKPEYVYSFGRQNWFSYSASEHRAFRENIAMFDQSSFSKYLVQGKHACDAMQRICSANVDVPSGKIVYTHWLNERGGIEADLTVSRFSENKFMVVSAAAVTRKDLDWLHKNIDPDSHCFITDVTNSWAVFGIMGPNSRSFLSGFIDADFSTQAFPFGTFRPVEIGCATGFAFRVSFVGELGWELYVPVDQARHAFDVIINAGESHDLKLAGMHSLDSGRIEKKFLHFGHDIADEDTPLEAGAAFVCDMNKPVPFIGHDAIARQKEKQGSLKKRLLQFLLHDPEAMLYHHEPIIYDGKTVGYLSSGNYGHTLGGSVGLGYVKHEDGISKDFIEAGRFEIDVAGTRIPATASLSAMYDPKGERLKS